jgi:hypothetical protein
MLILIRLATALAIFIVLFCALSMGTLILGAGFAGGRAGARASLNHQNSSLAGREAGRKFGREYGPMIFLGSFFVSGILSLVLSFTGILPWCRKPKPPTQI